MRTSVSSTVYNNHRPSPDDLPKSCIDRANLLMTCPQFTIGAFKAFGYVRFTGTLHWIVDAPTSGLLIKGKGRLSNVADGMAEEGVRRLLYKNPITQTAEYILTMVHVKGSIEVGNAS